MDKRNILLITDGWVHPPVTARFWLRYGLTVPEFQYKHENSMEALIGMDLEPFRGMVLYFHHEKISNQALDIFDEFVSNGGGVLAIHSATASFKEQDRFTDILGGKFKGHGPVENFDITPIFSQSGLFKGVPGFTVIDELYIHDLQPDIVTHFTTVYQGEPVPMVWTREHGKGRICYTCPGHRAASLRISAYRDILLQGLSWVTEREI